MHISHADLSLVLLMGGAGAVMSFPLSSRLMARHGGRLTMLIAGSALLLALLAIGSAPSVPLLMVAVLMFGITASTFDVGMNAVAAQQEKHDGQSRMALLHAHACAGSLAGVTLGSGMAAMQIMPLTHFAILVLPSALLLRYATFLLPAEREIQRTKPIITMPRGDLALLGTLGFLGAIAEGSIANWAGIFMKDHFGASDGFAPLSLSAFSAMMLLSRLWGDRLKSLYGAKPLVAGGALLAAGGMCFVVCAPDQYVALGGFAAAGMGLSLVFPFVFSAAGREGTIALASVATMAYSGSLMGPPLLGAIAHHIGMEAAMSAVGLLALLIAVTTTRTRLMR
jgi:MFS family permease